MSTFTKEELLKVAELSLLKLESDEVDLFAEQLRIILEYTEELANADISQAEEPHKPFNVFREDKVIKFDSTSLLENAPDREEHYFVMPQIINQQ